MASLSERLAYILTFDTTSGVRSLEKFGKKAEDELSKAEKANEKLAAGLTKTGAAMIALAGIAGVGLAKLGMGASDARQNFQALEQVVGTVDAVGIKAWADDAAQSIGTTSSKAVEAATSFAQLGKLTGMSGVELNDFSTNLVGLAADFSAFKNVSPEQALQDIRSGFSGSVETMRKYGIFLTEGILKNTLFDLTGEKVTGTLSAQQRILATNAELYKQGADMIGQFDRESESLVGQTAILRAELGNLANAVGEGVLPFMTAGVTAVGSLAEKMNDASPATKEMAGQMLTLGVASAALVGSLLLASGSALKLKKMLTTTSTVAGVTTTSLNGTGKAVRGVGVAFAAVAATQAGIAILNAATDAAGRTERAHQDLTITLGGLEEGTKTSAQVMEKFNQAVTEQANTARLSNLWTAFAGSIEVVGTETIRSIKNVDRAFEALAESSPAQAEAMLVAWRLQAEAMGSSGKDYEENIALIDRYTDRLALQTGAAAALAPEIEGVATAAETAAATLEGLNEQLARGAIDTDRIKEKFKEFDQGVQDASTALDDQRAAIGEWSSEIDASVATGAEAFLDFGDDAELSLAELTKGYQTSAAETNTWKNNLVTIGEAFGREFMESMALLGPAAEGAVAEIAAAPQSAAAQGTYSAWAVDTAVGVRSVGDELDKLTGYTETAIADAEAAALVGASLMLVSMPKEMENIGVSAGDAMAAAQAEAIIVGATLVSDAALGVVNGATEAIRGVFGGWRDVGASGTEELAAGIEDIAPIVGPIARAEGREVGRDLSGGIESGIFAWAKEVGSATISVVRGALAGVRNYTRTRSPSRLFAEEVGEPISQGIAVGIEDEAGEINDALTDAIEDAEKDAVDAARDLSEAVLEEFQSLADKASDVLSGLFDKISEDDKIEGLIESISDAGDRLVAAQENLAEVNADKGSTPREIADAYEEQFDAAERVSDAERTLTDSTQDLADIRADGESTARDIADAIEAESDAAESLSDLQRRLIDTETKLAEVLADKGSTLKEVADAVEQLDDAEEALRDANMSLTEATIANVEGTEDQQAAWEESATAAGLTIIQINALRDAYIAAAAARAALEQETVKQATAVALQEAAINAEATQANKIKTRFTELSNQGLLMEGDLSSVAGLSGTPGAQIKQMSSIISRVERFFNAINGGGPVSTFAPTMAAQGRARMGATPVQERTGDTFVLELKGAVVGAIPDELLHQFMTQVEEVKRRQS